MAETRPLYLGPRLRRLRRELGLTQQAMGEDLEISPSYVALLERNQRPLTADLLLRLAKTYKLEVADLASEDGEDYARRIGEILRDPIFADIDLTSLEVADISTSFPGVSEALLRLYGAYTREQQALAEQSVSGDVENETDPMAESRRFVASQRNYFPLLDERAEELSVEIKDAGGAKEWLRQRGVRIRFVPPDVLVDAIRRYDRHNEQLLIADTLDASSRSWQLAIHIAYTALRSEIGQIVREENFSSKLCISLKRAYIASPKRLSRSILQSFSCSVCSCSLIMRLSRSASRLNWLTSMPATAFSAAVTRT